MPADRRAEFERTALPCLASVAFLAQRLCGPGPDADDLAQETFLRAWAAFDRFERGTDARRWLLTIALNAFRDRMRRRGRDPLSLDAASIEPEAPEAPTGETAGGGAPRVEGPLRRALDALPEAQRTVLTLAVIEGLPRARIAEMLGCPEGTVRSLLSRAKARLRQIPALEPR
jgi:RNA polymerase sigma-70 factor (ECF subfamily)